MKKNPQTVTFTINGENKTFITEPDEKLLALLRREGYKGAKFGCGQGTCGSCTVLMDGRAVYSCLLYAMQAEGREIRTIESIGSHDKPSEFQQELIDGGAVQCGYCIPGMIMSATALMENETHFDDETVREYMDGNLCRCTGYEKIWAALRRVLDRQEAAAKK
ncbi:MAG: (2Fe-2S)-binding protein [Kiritimatiellae bacterium]|jgi:aerobic-type carbon monoxide dehydrogenase small subunit (CoxS/CutS family)|nr:(2Fe-2S)-binding protein [Kiritimatiellia bacterium]NCC92976.1 (2Fe-2S)-binding protein [Opitutae bacterium]MDD3441154.1 (2Fe-2S)-binding protein [Kiritimatiellia bacterium]MDD4117135.1 (2Fe-2S)-binding protein [Kiritimatiellia bacterium]HOO21734.1 (2Fe-2S)-binding protein [Kiritimatiellia bacterium]